MVKIGVVCMDIVFEVCVCLCYGFEVFVCMWNIALMGPCRFSGWIPEAICMLFWSWVCVYIMDVGIEM